MQSSVSVSTQIVISPSFVLKTWPVTPTKSPRSMNWLKKSNASSPRSAFRDIELDLAVLVTEVGEDRLPVVADDVEPSCRCHALFAFLVGDLCKLCPDVRYRVLPVERGGVEVDALFPQRTDFVEPGLVKCKGFGWIGHENAPLF